MARTALDDLIDIYREAQLALVKIITGNTGAGTKTYYNSVLKQTEALLNRLSAQTGRYINTEIPKEYKAALESTYDYFKRNRLQMKRPDIFAQVHADAVSELAAEMQHHIDEGISNAGRRVIRYADSAMDNALRQNGLRASAVKIASGQTVRDMQKDLVQRLSEDGFLTVQYGSGEGAYQVGLDSYASMVARSTTREAGNLAREKQLTDNGYDLMIITEHHPCCGQCARVQGRVFSISGDDKRFPPLSAAFPSGYKNVHPNCSCVAVPWIEELQSPEELSAALAKGSQPLRDERSAEEKAFYTQQQSDSRQMRADLVQFERYKARLGDDAPKSFSQFRRIKNEDGDKWESLQKEYRQKFEKVHNSSIDKSEKSDIIKAEEVSELEQAKKRDHKIKVNEIAIKNVDYVKPSDFTDEQALAMQLKHKELLKVAMDSNDSNEVLMISDLNFNSYVTILGEEFKVSPGKNPFAVSFIARSESYSLVYLHNHPSTNLFSIGDIDTFVCEKAIKTMSVVTNQGEVYIMNKTADYSFGKAKALLNSVHDSFTEKDIDDKEFVNRFLKRSREGGIEYVKAK